MAYWLFKSEPSVWGWDDQVAKGDAGEEWDGVRNYQARNFMRDEMQVGDEVFFYHSNATPPGIVGIARIASEAYPDPTQFDPDSKYFDPKSDPENPRWLLVDVAFVRKFDRILSLQELKDNADKLPEFRLLARGNRLSIMPVEKRHWQTVLKLL